MLKKMYCPYCGLVAKISVSKITPCLCGAVNVFGYWEKKEKKSKFKT
jgi:hypothetical protein